MEARIKGGGEKKSSKFKVQIRNKEARARMGIRCGPWVLGGDEAVVAGVQYKGTVAVTAMAQGVAKSPSARPGRPQTWRPRPERGRSAARGCCRIR